jgi:hypothetical protein
MIYIRIHQKHLSVIQAILQIALVSLFAYSGAVKLFDRTTFVFALVKSPLIPASEIITLISYSLPLIELLIAGALLFEKTKLIGFYLSFFLMSLFTVYLIVLVSAFSNLPCSCGGILGGMSYPVHIAFNIVFTLVALAGIYTSDAEVHSSVEHS